MYKPGLSTAAVLLLLLLYSCVPQNKVRSSKKDLNTINSQLSGNNEALNKLDAIRSGKENQNEIDDTTNSRLRQYIDATREEIDTLIKGNSILIGESVVDKNDWERL